MASDVELPLSAIDKQIASGIDIFVHLGRVNKNERKLLEIAEVLGMEGSEVRLQTLYRYEKREGEDVWIREGELEHTEKLQMYFDRRDTATVRGSKTVG